MEKKLDGNYTRMLQAILNTSSRQHPTKQQLYGYSTPITKANQVRRTKKAGHCWRSSDELISDILQWTPSHRRAKAGRPARTYIQQLCADTGCSLEDLPGTMNDKEGWWESVREIRAGGGHDVDDDFSLRVFIPAQADGLSLESECKQVVSCLQDYRMYRIPI